MTGEAESVGLLLCDHLDDEVVAQHGDYTELFPARFGPLGVDLRVYDVTAGNVPDDPRAHRGWIVSGSRHSAYEGLDWISDLEGFVRDIVAAEVPLVGICFGHQVIAQALGGEVAKADVGWGVGPKTFDVVDATGPVDGATMTLLMSHQDQVTELPADATVFATSDYCPVAGYRIGDHVLCVQGHPEFTAPLSRTLMVRRRDAIGADTVGDALAVLDTPLDHDRVAGWMAQFFDR